MNNIFGKCLNESNKKSEFQPETQIILPKDSSGEHSCIVISQWYAQPSRSGGHQIQYIIDPHYIFANNHAKECSSGLNQLGVRKDAWVSSKNCKENGTYLSPELVEEL